jgi:hypothetical protein
VAPAVPVESAPNPALDFSSNPEVTLTPPRYLRRSRRSPIQVLAILVAVVVLSVGALTGILLLVQKVRQEVDSPDVHQYEQQNFALRRPEAPWHKDEELANRMKAALGFSRSDPAGRFAVDVVDYRRSIPGLPVLVDEMLTRLTAYFGEVPAWQPAKGATRERLVPNGELAGQRALVLEFEGTRDNVVHSGECYIVPYQGFVYWVFTFGPQAGDPDAQKEIMDEWRRVRNGFSVLNRREGWKPLPRESQPFQGKGYALAHAKDVWKRQAPEGYDPAAELVLIGHDSRPDPDEEGSKAGKSAVVQVLLLPARADLKTAAAEARKHVFARKQEEQMKPASEFEFDPLDDARGAKQDGEADVGKAKGWVSKNRLAVKGGTAERFLLLAVVGRPDQTVALWCECEYSRRNYWELEFAELLESFTVDAE